LAMRELRGSGTTQRPAKRVKPVPDEPLDATRNYQLVLQFHSDSLQDFDEMVALEDELIEQLGDSADVDGHDVGSGETNIFIFTSDPATTFRRARPVLESRRKLQAVTVAYREVEGESYTVIWPVGSKRKFAIT
jgi:hypothetical protein